MQLHELSFERILKPLADYSPFGRSLVNYSTLIAVSYRFAFDKYIDAPMLTMRAVAAAEQQRGFQMTTEQRKRLSDAIKVAKAQMTEAEYNAFLESVARSVLGL